jgi:hypothetical protein
MDGIKNNKRKQLMKNLPFVIWLLGYSALDIIQHWINLEYNLTYSDGAVLISWFIKFLIWIFVAGLLYEEKS